MKLSKDERRMLLDALGFYLEQMLFNDRTEKPYTKLGDKLYFKGYKYEEQPEDSF